MLLDLWTSLRQHEAERHSLRELQLDKRTIIFPTPLADKLSACHQVWPRLIDTLVTDLKLTSRYRIQGLEVSPRSYRDCVETYFLSSIVLDVLGVCRNLATCETVKWMKSLSKQGGCSVMLLIASAGGPTCWVLVFGCLSGSWSNSYSDRVPTFRLETVMLKQVDICGRQTFKWL